MNITIEQIEISYKWLCKQRKHYPANADIWDVMFNWEKNKHLLIKRINTGHFIFSPIKRIYKENGQVVHLWSSLDSLVMKVLSEIITPSLHLSASCTHIKGHGGLKQTVKNIDNSISNYKFVCKTDVKHFYESINQDILYKQICEHVDDKITRSYLYQVIHRTVEYGGNYQDINRGDIQSLPFKPCSWRVIFKRA